MKKKDVKNLFEVFENEGTEYALLHYSDWEDIKDARFQELYKNFCKGYDELKSYLKSEAERNNVETDVVL